MSDLEQAISEWRQQMLAAGIKSPVPLEELEIHLREEIEQQAGSGVNQFEAFENAIRQMGTTRSLKKEFNKNNPRKIMKRILILILSVIAVLVGMAFVMPAAAQFRHEGAMAGGEVALFVLGCMLTLGGIGTAVIGVKRSRA